MKRSDKIDLSKEGMAIPGKKNFSGYGPEDEAFRREQKVEMTPALKRMVELWKALPSTEDERIGLFPDCGGSDRLPDFEEGFLTGYASVLEAFLQMLEYRAADVEAFTLLLAGFQEDAEFEAKSGLFLSALINGCKDAEFVINLRDIEKKPDYLGFNNSKKIRVFGDAGDSLGSFMSQGEIVVEGNAGNLVAWHLCGGRVMVSGDVGHNLGFRMVEGEVLVEGDADHSVGAYMDGGRITVKGQPAGEVAAGMESGELHFLCDGEVIAAVSERDPFYNGEKMNGGRVFHKGKLIAEDGRPVSDKE